MASHAQVHASTTGVGMIDSINGKINAVGVFIRGGVHIWTSLNLGRVAKVGDNFLGVFS